MTRAPGTSAREVRTWHIKRRLREQGRIDISTWALWATTYIETLEFSPWRTFCARERARVTGDYATYRMHVMRQREVERIAETVEAMASLGK